MVILFKSFPNSFIKALLYTYGGLQIQIHLTYYSTLTWWDNQTKSVIDVFLQGSGGYEVFPIFPNVFPLFFTFS